MIEMQFIKGLICALGVGLLIGVVRERKHGADELEAGIRTHALVAILGASSWYLGIVPFSIALVVLGALVVASYLRTSQRDPGLTGEVTIILNFSIAAMALVHIEISAGLGVLIAIFLQAKKPIHRFSRELITERELRDSLLLLASILIIMPLLPEYPIDKWNTLNLNTIWKIVVLIIATGMLGDIAQRALGTKIGLPIAGFFSGFASSTAAIASFGQKSKADPQQTTPAAAAALLANLSSLLLFIGIILTISKELFLLMLIPFIFSTFSLLITVFIFLSQYNKKEEDLSPISGKAFKLSHAFLIALAISSVSLISAWVNSSYGGLGVIITCVIAAMAEIHASAATLAQLASKEVITHKTAQWGIIGALTSSALAKITLSYFSGGKDFALRVSMGMMLMIVGTILGVLLF